MERITLYLRTKKSKNIKLRFRLTDGRTIQLYHKSEIKADLVDLAKFTEDGNLKPRTAIYNHELLKEIQLEIAAMKTAYRKFKEKGQEQQIDSETFENEVRKSLNPELYAPKSSDTLLEKFREIAEKKFNDNVIGTSRYKHSIVIGNILERFLTITRKKTMTVQDATPDFIMGFRQFITNEYKYVKTYEGLYENMADRNIPKEPRSHNTVVTALNHLQAFFTELEDTEVIIKSPFRKLGKERKRIALTEHYDEPIYLLKEEFQAIMAQKVPEYLQETKDAFLLQCAFGCRISDFKRLTMANVDVDQNGIPFIHYLPQKTIRTSTEDVITPIMHYALQIIKKYQFNFHILRYVSGKSGYNFKIKELLQLTGINRKCSIYDEKNQQNIRVPLYELGSSKLCRKTHVDMMAKAQINEYAAGLHKEGSDAVKRYTSLGLKDRFILMCVAFDQEMYKVDNELNIIE